MSRCDGFGSSLMARTMAPQSAASTGSEAGRHSENRRRQYRARHAATSRMAKKARMRSMRLPPVSAPWAARAETERSRAAWERAAPASSAFDERGIVAQQGRDDVLGDFKDREARQGRDGDGIVAAGQQGHLADVVAGPERAEAARAAPLVAGRFEGALRDDEERRHGPALDEDRLAGLAAPRQPAAPRSSPGPPGSALRTAGRPRGGRRAPAP